jgi:hypothetical protein
MTDITTYGQIKGGKLELYALDRLAECLKELEDGPICIVFSVEPIKQSHPLRKYYHGLVIPIITDEINEQSGSNHTRLEVKTWMKDLHNNGESTTKLSLPKYVAFVDLVRLWGEEMLGVTIPDPDKEWRKKRIKKPTNQLKP